MKRLILKHFFYRNKYNSIKSKLHFCSYSKTRLRNFCLLTGYSKNVSRIFHLSAKQLKFCFRYGQIVGVRKASF